MYEAVFEDIPTEFTHEEKREWMKKLENVAMSSDAFFPFVDNVFRAARSGVKYIAAPGGSVNDKGVHDAAEQCGITFVDQSTRLFHH